MILSPSLYEIVSTPFFKQWSRDKRELCGLRLPDPTSAANSTQASVSAQVTQAGPREDVQFWGQRLYSLHGCMTQETLQTIKRGRGGVNTQDLNTLWELCDIVLPC